MKINNPWVDPRVQIVSTRRVEAYLISHGWKPLGPSLNPILVRFESPIAEAGTRTVLLPLETNEGSLLQRMIDLIGEVAQFEDRWAADVVNDILANGSDESSATSPSSASVS